MPKGPARGLAMSSPVTQTFIIFLLDNRTDDMSCAPTEFQKKKVANDKSFGIPRFRSPQWLMFFFLKPIFNSKYLENTLITFINQSLTSKSVKNRSKTQNQLGNQFLSNLKSGFLGTFKIRKNTQFKLFSSYGAI
jgi:hypothetical protein